MSVLALEARVYRKPVIVVSVLGPLGYILVLFAMRLAPAARGVGWMALAGAALIVACVLALVY